MGVYVVLIFFSKVEFLKASLAGEQQRYAEVEATLQRLRSALVDALAATAVPVTVSIGIVTFVDVPDDIEDMVQRADAAMYRAKTGGKNRLWLELAPMEAERRV